MDHYYLTGDIDQEKRWHYYETLRRVYQDAFHNMQHQQYVEYVGDFGDTAQLPV
jgi:hypothetical protein